MADPFLVSHSSIAGAARISHFGRDEHLLDHLEIFKTVLFTFSIARSQPIHFQARYRLTRKYFWIRNGLYTLLAGLAGSTFLTRTRFF